MIYYDMYYIKFIFEPDQASGCGEHSKVRTCNSSTVTFRACARG